MRTCLARIIVSVFIVMSGVSLAACERRDAKEAERLGRDSRKNVEKIEEGSDVDLDI